MLWRWKVRILPRTLIFRFNFRPMPSNLCHNEQILFLFYLVGSSNHRCCVICRVALATKENLQSQRGVLYGVSSRLTAVTSILFTVRVIRLKKEAFKELEVGKVQWREHHAWLINRHAVLMSDSRT